MSGVKIYNVGLKAIKFSPRDLLPSFVDLYLSKVAIGYSFGLTANVDGTVSAWGNDAYGQTSNLGSITNAKAVGATSWRSVILTEQGQIIVNDGDNPSLTSTVIFPSESQFTQVYASSLSTSTNDDPVVGIRTDDTIVSKGKYTFGGISADFEQSMPGVKSVAYNNNSTYAVNSSGSIEYVHGTSGGFTIPTSTNGNTTKISGGYNFFAALLTDGTVEVFGTASPNYGQYNVPAGLTDVVDISAGRYHVAALKSDGSIVTWGSYYDGGSIAFPSFQTGITYAGIMSGFQSTIAYDVSGNLYLVGQTVTGLTNWTGSGYNIV